jgi:hypothetical protein
MRKDVVDAINHLNLPRYGLGKYLVPSPHQPPTQPEGKVIQDLSRAGKRLMGFCRTNLFKRLESSGQAFMHSAELHILRNYIYLHAIENDLPIPIGTQDAELLDSRFTDDDEVGLFESDDEDNEECWRARFRIHDPPARLRFLAMFPPALDTREHGKHGWIGGYKGVSRRIGPA